MRKQTCILVAACAAFGVQAADPTLAELQQQLQELAAKIEQLEQKNAAKLTEIEKKNSDRIARLEADSSATIAKLEAAEPMELPKWIADTQFKGDFRYRYENVTDDGTTAQDRQRVRLRVGVYGPVNDYIDYGIRVATGGASATSSNQTLGDTQNGKFGLNLDRIYVDIHHEKLKGAHLIMGKMPQPWHARTGLVWDSDLNPEGIAATYSKNMENGITLHANAGAFIIDDENPAGTDGGDDPRMWAGQLVMDTKIGDAKVQLGVSDYWFENVDYYGLAAGANTPGGGFNLVEGFGSVSTKVGDLPVKVYGQVVNNTEAADSDQDTAYLVGLTLGKAKAPGSWEVGYNWRDIENDAVVDDFNDGDFAVGFAGSYGHTFKAKYQIAKNWQAGATYLMAVNNVGDDVNTFQADLNFKF
jgi:hypothetical protein